jgi:hypothetical protein
MVEQQAEHLLGEVERSRRRGCERPQGLAVVRQITNRRTGRQTAGQALATAVIDRHLGSDGATDCVEELLKLARRDEAS